MAALYILYFEGLCDSVIMAAPLNTYFLLTVTLSVANGMIWARNTQELNNRTTFESEFSTKLEGIRVERRMAVGEDRDYSEPWVSDFREPSSTLKPSNLRISVTTSDGTPVSSFQISPNLVIIYADLIKRMAVGIILKRRTVLTTCVSTLVWLQGQLFSIKAESLVILSEVTATTNLTGGAKETTILPVNIVADIRRHPFCGMPFGGGPWMNDMAVLILHAELIQSLNPINLASEDVFDIFADVQKKISSGAVCRVIGIEFKITTLAFHGTSIDVKIVEKSKCGRLCNYMISQCEPQIGGYFVQFVNSADRNQTNDWMAEAALVCDGKLFGVVKLYDFACDASLAGLAPKPEAVLHMHLSTLKLIGENHTTKPPPLKQGAAAAVISSSWAAHVAMTAICVSRSE